MYEALIDIFLLSKTYVLIIIQQLNLKEREREETCCSCSNKEMPVHYILSVLVSWPFNANQILSFNLRQLLFAEIVAIKTSQP